VDDLLAPLESPVERLRDGMVLFRARADGGALLPLVRAIEAQAPFRHMVTPGGYAMSVAMTNCGERGWVTDRSGYRYSAVDPVSGRAWPAMPDAFHALAQEAAAEAGFAGFDPDACLLNRYEPGAKLSAHQDRDEQALDQPVVSVSFGLPAVFQVFGEKRSGKPQNVVLHHGDVLVFGGPSRLVFHGVKELPEGAHPMLGRARLNMTFRRAAA
jgi:DNA oxidative demethylase